MVRGLSDASGTSERNRSILLRSVTSQAYRSWVADGERAAKAAVGACATSSVPQRGDRAWVDAELADEIELYATLVEAVGARPLSLDELDAALGVIRPMTT